MSEERPYNLYTPALPAGKELWVRRVTGREALSELYEYAIDLLSLDHALDLDSVLGHEMSIGLDLPAGGERFLHGYVSSFSLVGEEGEHSVYRAMVHPHLWRLTRTRNSRIFQKKSVPEIVKEILTEHGIADVETHYGGDSRGGYLPWDYCVQYQETDFAFVSRLLENEGIHYFFHSKKDRHVLVLSDSIEGHAAAPHYDQLKYRRVPMPNDSFERIWGWQLARTVLPGRYTVQDYDFTKPGAQLLRESTSTVERKHPKALSPDYEIFEYPEPVVQQTGYAPAIVEDYSRLRIEELHARYEVVKAETSVRAVGAGDLWKLDEGARPDAVGKTFLTVGCAFHGSQDPRRSSAADGAPVYRATLEAIDSRHPFRPRRQTPKPRIVGPQTAVVVGKAGEEIWTDKYGRVKVQFTWDRVGKKNEESSCWVRVSQVWAGGQWGSIHVPRIGQEVIVEFLDGDPDRPIITGRVYNGSNMPPYELPAKQTQSGIKSRSTKGGGVANANEIRFEDKKGAEEFFVQAERDHNTVVKRAQTLDVGDTRAVKVKADETIAIGAKRTTTVHAKDTVTLEDEHEMTVTKKVTETFKDDHALTITGQQTIDIKKDKTEHVTQTYDLKTDQKFLLTQGGTTLTFESNAVSLDAKSKITITRGPATVTIDEAGAISLSTPTGITLQSGPSSIKITATGVEVAGLKIALAAAATSLELTPATGKLTGPIVNVIAAGICAVKGAVLKLG